MTKSSQGRGGSDGGERAWSSGLWLLRVKLDFPQPAEAVSLQPGEGREQVLAVVEAVDANERRPVAEAGLPVRPPQSQVVTVDLATENRAAQDLNSSK